MILETDNVVQKKNISLTCRLYLQVSVRQG